MKSIRKWFCKPKRNDHQLLAQFYFANEELNEVSQELDSFDGRQDQERCTTLVNQLRRCQDNVLAIVEQIMEEAIHNERSNRDYRAKFPEDVLLDSLPGQLWFGAECLGAGSTIMNREIESAALRPLARGLTKTLDTMRMVLKNQCYENLNEYSDKVKDVLKKFDETFAEFELSYVSTMVAVKSVGEYDTQQDVIVLFCETLNRALTQDLLTQDQVDDYDPGLMFTIPRLAIVNGLLVFPNGPLNMDKAANEISELFRPFQALLLKIKELLQTLSEDEFHLLEKALCISNGSWEDIEKQLKLMGKEPKVRCHVASQTEISDILLIEKSKNNDVDSEFLLFGMSPMEEVKSHVESEMNILGTSPDKDNGQSSVLIVCGEETVEDVCKCALSVVDEDNHKKDSGISSPPRNPVANLSNGDIFDDVESHSLGISSLEQRVQYNISPRYKPTVLKRPLLDRVDSFGHDGMSHVYGMSPVESSHRVFGRDSPQFSMSPLDSPSLDSYTDAHSGSSDVLGVSPVETPPMVMCLNERESEVDTTCPGYKTVDSQAESEDNVQKIFQKCNQFKSESADSGCVEKSNDTNHIKNTNGESPGADPSENLNDCDIVETILEEIQNTETHQDASNYEDSSNCVQLLRDKDKLERIKVCQELVENIVFYAVQYSTFTSQHSQGRCLAGLNKCSEDSHGISSFCQSCSQASFAKDKSNELYCRQCKSKGKNDHLPLCQNDIITPKNSETKVVKGGLDDPTEQLFGTSETYNTQNNQSVDIQKVGEGQDGSVARQLERKCTCAIAPSGDDIKKCSFCEVSIQAEKSPPGQALQSINPEQDTEIIYSTGAMQTSQVVGSTPEGASWNSDGTEMTCESFFSGKGTPSTELSHAFLQTERLALHVDVSRQFTRTLSDNSPSESYSPRNHTGYQVSSPSSGRVYPASAINRVTGSRGLRPETKEDGGGGRDRRESNVSTAICSSCGDELVDDDDVYQWESDESDTDSTSSISDNDEHEIAIAIQAAELSAKQEARSHFSSSWDLVHRLFVCIAGVADQLQTNYASDLRNILKTVFEITANPHKPIEDYEWNYGQYGVPSVAQTPSGTEEETCMADNDNQLDASASQVQEESSELSPEERDDNCNDSRLDAAGNSPREESKEQDLSDTKAEEKDDKFIDSQLDATGNSPQESIEQDLSDTKDEGQSGQPFKQEIATGEKYHEEVSGIPQMQQQLPNENSHADTLLEGNQKESWKNRQESKLTTELKPAGVNHDRDVSVAELQQDSVSTDVHQDIVFTGVHEGNMSTDVQGDRVSTDVLENNVSIVVQEDKVSTYVQKNNASTDVQEDKVSTYVQENNAFTDVQEDNISTYVQENNASADGQEDKLSTYVQENNASADVQEDKLSTYVQENNASADVQEDKVSTYVQENNASADVQEDKVSNHVQEDKLSTYSQEGKVCTYFQENDVSTDVQKESVSTDDRDVPPVQLQQDNGSTDVLEEDVSSEIPPDVKSVTSRMYKNNDRMLGETLQEVKICDMKQTNNLQHDVTAANEEKDKECHQQQHDAPAVGQQTFSLKRLQDNGPESRTPQNSKTCDEQQASTVGDQREKTAYMEENMSELKQDVPADEIIQGPSDIKMMPEGDDDIIGEQVNSDPIAVKLSETAAINQMETAGGEATQGVNPCDEKAINDTSPVVKPKKRRHKSGDLTRRSGKHEEPPMWIPDEVCSQCMSCQAVFTMIRRKHHCRNCGKIFCSRCSANCVPLPKFGQEKPVRVCNRCYMFHVTPFQH